MSTGNVPTIKDVAERAGASIATVSRIINGRGGVSSELEERIRSAIGEIGYVPNTVARALKARATKSLGLVIPSIENPVFPPLVRIIEKSAAKQGFSTFLCNSENDLDEEARYLALLVEKKVDGIIFNAIGDYDPRFEIVRKTHTPIVVVGRAIPSFRSTIVTVDNFGGAYTATAHLLGKGKRRIAYLYGELESKTALNDRFAGYRQAIQDNGLEVNEALVSYSRRSVEGGVAATEQLLAAGVAFDGIFASNDVMAMGCIGALLQAGIRVPGEVSVIGFDDIPFADIFVPRLTTVHSPLDLLGTAAVKALLRIIRGGKDRATKKVLAPSLIVRDSSV